MREAGHSWNDFKGISTARAGGGATPVPPGLPLGCRSGQPLAAQGYFGASTMTI